MRRQTHSTRHKTETTETRSDTERTLTTELDSDETERLITGRDEREVGTTEQVRRERCELGLGEDAIRVELHETVKLLGGETTIKINDGTDSDELNGWTLLKAGPEKNQHIIQDKTGN